jgi:hypothetical protein
LQQCPRPEWLNDRECDNWSNLFAVAQAAGGHWPDSILESSKLFAAIPGEDGDLGERLIHDLRAVFTDNGNPEAIKSGNLTRELSRIETSPWGDYYGKSLSPTRLAKLLKPFEVGPDQRRTSGGEKIRGYWLSDLLPLFDRYPFRPGQLGQGNEYTTDEQAGKASVPPVPDKEGKVEGGANV